MMSSLKGRCETKSGKTLQSLVGIKYSLPDAGIGAIKDLHLPGTFENPITCLKV